MKKLMSRLLLACMMVLALSLKFDYSVNAAPSGSGTKANPYVVRSYDDLKMLVAYEEATSSSPVRYIKLAADLHQDDNKWDNYIGVNNQYAKVVLDLAGHSLSRNAVNTVDNGIIEVEKGNLTINDSVGGGKMIASGDLEAVLCTYGGTLTINAGTYESKGTTEDQGCIAADNGTLIINDGEFKTSAWETLHAKNGANVEINGGKFYRTSNKNFPEKYYTVRFDTDGDVEINKCVIYGGIGISTSRKLSEAIPNSTLVHKNSVLVDSSVYGASFWYGTGSDVLVFRALRDDLIFGTMTPSATAAELSNHETDLGDVAYGETLIFGFVPKALPGELTNMGYTIKEKVYVNYDWKGTLVTRKTGAQFDLMQYVTSMGSYQVWMQMDLYKGDEYITSNTHIFDVNIIPYEVKSLSASVPKPVVGQVPEIKANPGGEGYKTTDVDWQYYDAEDDEYYIMKDGQVFEEGKKYRCTVQFEAMDGYTFPESNKNLKSTINGNTAKVTGIVYSTKKAYADWDFTMEVLQITGQPQGVTVAPDETAVFEVIAKGSGALQYQWQYRTGSKEFYKNWPQQTDYSSNRLSFKAPKSYNGYQFRCVIKDVLGNTIVSDGAYLRVVDGVTIVTQPANQTVAEGGKATFKVEATGSGLKYQWQFKNATSDYWSNSTTAGATTNSITVEATKARNGYQYRCVVKDSNGKSVTSNAAKLTVTEATTLEITTQPASQTVAEGGKATFKVVATGTGLKYQWQFKSASATYWSDSSMTGATTNSITVEATKARNGYQYRCVVKDSSGKSVTSNAAKLTVTAATTLAITTQPANQTVAEGGKATFKVVATGTGLKYQWQFKSASATYWSDSSMTGATTNSITVEATKARNGYQYRCVVKDSSGKSVTSNAAKLTVTAASTSTLAITTQPANQTVAEGGKATFKVVATGTGLKYQWQFKNTTATSWSNSGMAGATTNSITVEATKARNGYQYRCVVKDANDKSVTSNAAKLTVVTSTPMSITSQPASASVSEGGSATFKVVATGNGLTYQWQFKNATATYWSDSTMAGSKTNSITVSATAARNGYQYRCVVKDANGNKITTNAAKLTVNQGVKITGQPTSANVSVGAKATFKVTASGSNLTYQWQFKNASATYWSDSSMAGSKTNSITVEATNARNGYQYRCVVKDGSGNKVTSNAATLTVK